MTYERTNFHIYQGIRIVFIFGVLFRKMPRKLLLFVIAIVVCVATTAQTKKRARKLLSVANENWSEWYKTTAYKKLSKAIKKDPHSPELYAQLGGWYFQQHRFSDAARTYRDGFTNCPKGARYFALPLARSLVYNEMPDSALRIINAYAPPGADTMEWGKLRRQCDFVKFAFRNMHSTWPVGLGHRINSKYPELFPAQTTDSSVLYFTRRLNNVDEDFYVVNADSCGEWLKPYNMGKPLNTSAYEGSQCISADGHYLFFSRSDNRSDNGWAEGGNDLFMAYRVAADSAWSVPRPFGATINTPAYEGMPCLSPDNRELYFVSDRPGGYGGLDIWVSRFENSLWQLPVNAGPMINTAGDETAPFIALDNKTFLFTSNGHDGMGGTDLYISRRINDSTFVKAENMGYPINTAHNEQSEWISSDGKRLFFASDRQGPAGNYDIYQAELDMHMQPAPVSFFSGYIYDSLTHERLNFAAIFLIDARNGDTIYTFQSNRGDGSFLMPVFMNKKYAMHTMHVTYSNVQDTFSFDKPYTYTPYVHNVAMLPENYKEPIHDSLLAVVHFDVNRVELSKTDMDAITKGIDPFLLEDGYMIYINGYTDNTGTPMLNEELSNKRANQVGKILMALGVSEAAIVAHGWGEANPIAPNDTEENQRKNRRVEVRLRR